MNDFRSNEQGKDNSNESTRGNLTCKPYFISLLSTLIKKSDEPVLIPYTLGNITESIEHYDGYYDNSISPSENYDKSSNNLVPGFIEATINKQYKAILLCLPPYSFPGSQSTTEKYLDKCLDLLSPEGKLIILVRRNWLSGLSAEKFRKKIITHCSIHTIIDLQSPFEQTNFSPSIIIAENHLPVEQIRMITDDISPEQLLEHINDNTIGFSVSKADTLKYNRLDPVYYKPENRAVRELMQNRNAKKLGDLATITTGRVIPNKYWSEQGDYLVLRLSHISDGHIDFTQSKPIYITKETKELLEIDERYLLRKNDLLIKLVGKPGWGFYTGDEDYAIASPNTAIVRFPPENLQLIGLFLNTKVGQEYFKAQLEFILSWSASIHHIPLSALHDISIPDDSLIRYAEQVQNSTLLIDKVETLFKNLGWTVEKEFSAPYDMRFDLALFHNKKLYAVIETKRHTRNQLAHATNLCDQFIRVQNAMNDIHIYLFYEEKLYEFSRGNLFPLPVLPRPEDITLLPEPPAYNIEPQQNITINVHSQKITDVSVHDQAALEIAQAKPSEIKEILVTLHRMEDKIDTINDKIDALTKQLTSYQSLVSRQLEYTESETEKEHIIQALADEFANQALQALAKQGGNREYDKQLRNLILTFTEDTWNQLEESSQSFLVSAKITFAQLCDLSDCLDYSGVCLLVTKALEVEAVKRFGKGFVDYMKEMYPGKSNYALYPTPLLNQYGKPRRPKDFTLGTLPYVLCLLEDDSQTEEQQANNKARLIEYAKAKLFAPGTTEQKIQNTLNYYAQAIEDIKNDYRNPAAHTNQLQQINAQECFDFVVDVDQILKKMLEAFIL